MANLKKNLGYQTVYQLLNTCLPLITAPYLSRVLGATQLGIQSYVSSISSYFALFAMLGIVNYGTRAIAEKNNDFQERSRIFWEIYAIQFFFSVLMSAGYFLFYIFSKENRLIILLQGIAVFSCIFDIGWLFFGLEKFEITVKRNIIVRIMTVIITIVFVKNEGDLWKYVLILVMSTFINNIILWKFLGQFIHYIKPNFGNIIKHFVPILVLFVPLLALSVYHLMDKTMLGMMSTFEESGYYYNADKIVNIPIGVLTGVGTVLLPRITSLLRQQRKDEADQLFLVSLQGIIIASIAISFGIAAVAKEFIPFFFGGGYDSCILLAIVLSPVLVIKSVSLTFRNAYLIPNNRDKCFVCSVIAGAIANVISNYFLIPRHGALGAVIGTLIAECVSLIWQIVGTRKEVKFAKTFLDSIVYLAIGFVMFFSVRWGASVFDTSNLIKLICEIPIGVVAYCVLTFLYLKLSKNTSILMLFLKKG